MNIIKVELKRSIKSLLTWSIVTSLILILFMSLYPSFKDSGMVDIINAEIDALPKAMLEMFNMKDTPNFSNITEYFAYSFQYILMVSGIYGGILGVNSLISEKSDGTIEFLYSKPVSREKIAGMKIISNLLVFLIFSIIISIVSLILIIVLAPDGTDLLKILVDTRNICIGFIVVGLVFLSAGFLISTIIKSSKSAIALSLGVFFATYFIGVISKIKDNVNWLKVFSPYENFIPGEIVKSGLNITYIIGSICIIIICITCSMIIYKRKDFRI